MMALCVECCNLSPYTLLARPLHNPRDEDAIDPLMYLLKPSFSSLQKSAETCQLCNLILHDIELNYDIDDLIDSEKEGLPTPIQVAANSATGVIETHNEIADDARLSTLWVICGKNPGRKDRSDTSASLGLILAADDDNLATTSGDISGRLLADDAGSPKRLQMAQIWLDKCLASHEKCWPEKQKPRWQTSFQPITNGTILPTRIIDVGSSDGLEDPRLFVPGTKRGRYAALSHCWGKSHLITTTRATIMSHMQRISFDELPRTFQDAIFVTRQLGLRYLWIDSLCIVQDNIDDWQREAARMAGVYTNAVLTIAATAAKDSSEGLFFPRLDANGPRVEVQYDCRTKRGRGEPLGAGTMIICHQRTAYDADEEDAIDRAPLNQRAWVLQERLLSRRTLHFAARQMYWECNCLFASEDGTVYDSNPSQRLKQSFPVVEPPSERFGRISFDLNIIKSWCRLVEEYTQRSLTKDTDRLPALAGVVTSVFRKLEKTEVEDYVRSYIAGIWKQHLHINLLWQAKHGGGKRLTYFRAPSWSWAAIEGAIQYDTWLLLTDISTTFGANVYAEVDVKGDWLTGELLSAVLSGIGILKEATYDPTIKFDMGVPETDTEQMFCGTLFCKEKGETLGWCALDEATSQRKQDVWCLVVSRSEASDVVYKNRGLKGTENILVLTRRDGQAEGEFVRVGTGQIDRKLDWYKLDYNWKQFNFDEIKNSWKKIKIF